MADSSRPHIGRRVAPSKAVGATCCVIGQGQNGLIAAVMRGLGRIVPLDHRSPTYTRFTNILGTSISETTMWTGPQAMLKIMGAAHVIGVDPVQARRAVLLAMGRRVI